MAQEFDIAPTFLRKSELRNLFRAAAATHAAAQRPAAALLFPGFVELLGLTALAALSKPTFVHLYPTAEAKVAVLLEMWGVADPSKLEEIVSKGRERF